VANRPAGAEERAEGRKHGIDHNWALNRPSPAHILDRGESSKAPGRSR